MPPRKEPKETVVYPASKRKAPPFKPQRPSKVPRIPTTDSESSRSAQVAKPTAPARRVQSIQQDDGDDDVDDAVSRVPEKAPVGTSDSDSDEELDENPLAPKPTKKKPPQPSKAASTAKRKPPRQPSPTVISSPQSSPPASPDRATARGLPPEPSQSDNTAIPQPLLIRLLHENFANKDTKIDKHAILVLQRYFEVFVREAIARARLQKQEDAESAGNANEAELGWLELEDLEKVAAGMLLDF